MKTYTTLCKDCFWRCLNVPSAKQIDFDKSVEKHIDMTHHKVRIIVKENGKDKQLQERFLK